MKKYNLFKVLLITVLIAVVLSWLVPYGNVAEPKTLLGLWELLIYPYNVIDFLGQYILFFIAIGIFYGILNKTGVYSKILKSIAKKVKGKETKAIIIISIFLGVLVSFTGIALELYVFIPFLISLLLMLGYDKLTSLSVVLGSIFVGIVGSSFGYNVQGYANRLLGLNMNDGLVFKLILLVLGLALLLFETIRHIKKNGIKNKKDDILFYEKNESKKSITPAIIVLSLMAISLILGLIRWEYLNENWTLFSDFHDKLLNIKALTLVFNGSQALGTWNVISVSAMLFVGSIVLSFVYSFKLNDIFSSALEGIKRSLPTAAYIFLGLFTLYLVLSNPFITPVVEWIAGITGSFNLIFAVLATAVGSLFLSDVIYLTQVTAPILLELGDKSILMALIIQSIYGLVMFIAPTSLILLAGLSYTKVSYLEWLKHIWKFLWKFMIVVFLILAIAYLI